MRHTAFSVADVLDFRKRNLRFKSESRFSFSWIQPPFLASSKF